MIYMQDHEMWHACHKCDMTEGLYDLYICDHSDWTKAIITRRDGSQLAVIANTLYPDNDLQE